MKRTASFLTILLCLSTGITLAQSKGDVLFYEAQKYEISGENLIPNPSFNDGVTGWKNGAGTDLTTDKFEVVPSGGVDGAYLHAITSGGSSSSSTLRTAWPVEVGKTYYFSCYANRGKSAMSGNTQYSLVFSGSTETSADVQLKQLSFVADTWVKNDFVFTADKPFLMVRFAWLNSNTSFDQFFLAEVIPAEYTLEDKMTLFEALIDKAHASLASVDSTTYGSKPFLYPQTSLNAFEAAINKAETDKPGLTTIEAVTTAYEILEAAMTAFNERILIAPDPTTEFNIIHSGGFYLTYNTLLSNYPIIGLPTGGDEQRFRFIANGSSFSIQLVSTNQYLAKISSSNWDMTVLDGNEVDDARFELIKNGSTFSLKCLARSYLGTNSSSDGSQVYCDKSASAQNSMWTIVEASDSLIIEPLFNTIDNAKETLSTANTNDLIGERSFQHPQALADALQAAIDTAEIVYASAIQQEVINTALNNLISAISTFTNTFSEGIPLVFEANTPYSIIHSSWKYLAADENTVIIQQNNDSTNQQFMFELADTEQSAYTIKNAANNLYLAQSSTSSWDLTWISDPIGNNQALFVIHEVSPTMARINCLAKSNLGTDAVTEGATVYCDKNGQNTYHYWLIETYSLTANLKRLVLEAEQLLKSEAVGNNPGEHPTIVATALQTQIDQAKAVYSSNDKAVVKAQESSLNEAVSAFKTTFIPFTVTPGAIYNIRHSSGNNLTANGTTATIEAPDEGNATQQFQFVPANDSCYHIKNKGTNLYLAKNGAYNTTWIDTLNNNTSLFSLETVSSMYVRISCFDNNRYLGTDGSSTSQSVYCDKDGLSRYHQWALIPTTSTDYTLLLDAIHQADSVSKTMVVGELMDEFYFSTFTSFIDSIEAYRTIQETETSQELVDSAANKLKELTTATLAKAHKTAINIVLVINEVATYAQSLCDSTLNKEGYAEGDYLPSTRSAFSALKDSVVNNPSRASLNRILVACEVFLTDFIKQNRVELGSKLQQAKNLIANTAVGHFNGMTTQENLDVLSLVVTDAQHVYDAFYANSQQSIDSTTLNLAKAVSTFTQNLVHVSFTQFDKTLQAGEYFYTSVALVGDTLGGCPTTLYNTFKATCDSFKTIDKNLIDQIQSDSLANIFMSTTHQFVMDVLSNALLQAQRLSSESVIGTFESQHPQTSLDVLTASINAAKAEYQQPTNDTLVFTAFQELVKAMYAFNATVIHIDFSHLDATRSKAESLIQNTTKLGNDLGECPELNYNNFQAFIIQLNNLDRTKIAQDSVNSLNTALQEAINTFQQLLKTVSGLSDLISEAESLRSATTVGSNPGQCSYASKSTFKKAIDTAKDTLALPTVFQTTLNNAYQYLYQAINDFKTSIVTHIEMTKDSPIKMAFQQGMLHIHNLESNTTLHIFSLSGQLVCHRILNDATASIGLSPGKYLIILTHERHVYQEIVIAN